MVEERLKLCRRLIALVALVDEDENDMWSLRLRLSGGSLMHLTRNMMSWSSNQYMRGSKWREDSLDL